MQRDTDPIRLYNCYADTFGYNDAAHRARSFMAFVERHRNAEYIVPGVADAPYRVEMIEDEEDNLEW